MRKIFTLAFISICFYINAQTVDREYVDGQVYLKFKTGTIKNLSRDNPNNLPLNKISIIKDLIGKYGITKASKPFYQADDSEHLTHVLQLDFSNISKVEDLITDLKQNGIVEYAEKVMLLTTHATPNDPTFPSHLTQIGAQNAWNIWNGTANGNSNITVAIVDNAVAINHVDLTGNVWVNPGEIASNGIDDDQNGYVDDINGWDVADGDNNPIPSNNSMNHGTHCAGIAGARTDNGIGIASIGWNIKIIGVKCQNNTGNTTSIPFGYQGIIYAAKAKARVISCSFGGTGAASSAAQAIIDFAWSKGSIIMASAGNDNNSVLHYPAAYNNVYAVAACSGSDVKSSFSCFGTWVDITAPGNSINSTLPGNTYGSQSGTSMSCPLVAGLAGLMLSKYPWMTQTDVLNCISTTAVNIYTLSGNSAFVTPPQLGAGRINAFAAMQCAASFTGALPIGNFYTLTRNTCPNTPITFKDSSMYNPQTWNWSFPGGTPATSTSSNPTISYANPGTYNVTMTVSNTNGNSVKVRNSYITIAGPIALPLVEGFQNTQFLPTNWTPYNIDNDSIFWKRVTGRGGFTVTPTAACAMFNDYEEDATGAQDEMRTPRYIFSNVANARLRFDVAYKQYDNTANITPANPYSDTLQVRLSTNCGVSWSNIYTKGGQTLSTSPGTLQASRFVPTATEWRRDSIIITPAAAFQANVMMSFVNRGHYGQAMYLDNINIYLPPPSMAVTNSSTGCTGVPTLFTNGTTGAAGYTWTANPAATIASPNGTNTNITFNSPGTYSITLTANNGTVISTLTKTVSVATQPTVALTTSTTNICSGTNVNLTASGASSYSWSTGATSSGINVTPTVTTTYSVTGTNGSCTDMKVSTVNVTLTPNVGVTNQTICAGGQATITASGASTYSWSTGFTGNPLQVSPVVNTTYTVIGNNGVCANTKTVSVAIGSSITIVPVASTQTMCTGGTSTLSATGATTYTWNPGNIVGSSLNVTPASTTVYTVTGTNGGCNGLATIGVSVITAPVLNVTATSNSICAGGTTTMNATGYSTYTWNPGNLNGTSINVTPASSQVYTVVGTLGNCTGNKTHTISVVANPTVSIAGSSVICAGNSVVITASGAGTYSWNTSATTNSISVSPVTTTTYSVIGYNSTCTGNAVKTISVNPTPTVSVSTPSNPICVGDGINLTGSGANTYSWSTGSTFNQIFISPTVTTNYTLTGTTNGCSHTTIFTQSVVACGGVGLNNNAIANSKLLIYPNPFKDNFTISYLGNNFSYAIYDNIGRLIISKSNLTDECNVDLTEFAKGIYYIEVTNSANNNKTRTKLIAN